MPTNFYKQGTGYFTTDGKRIANTGDLTILAKSGGVEVDPTTKQPLKQQTAVIRPGAYGASDWRSLQAMKDSASGLIDILNKKNADLTESQNYFTQAYKDTSAFGGPRDVTTQPNAMITSNKNFRELSPSEQASIIASRQSAALAGLQTVADERASREKIYGSGLSNLRQMYEDQQAAKEREIDNARQQEALNLSKSEKGIGGYDEQGNYQSGSRIGGSASWRNNNPGNIKFSEWSKSMGAVQGSKATDGGYFALFPDLATGEAAQKALLLNPSYTKLDLNTAMLRWSGGLTNGKPNGKGYTYDKLVKFGAPPMGINTSLEDFTPEDMAKLQAAMRKAEGWTEGKLTSQAANDRTETQLIALAKKTGVPIADLKTYTAQRIADLESLQTEEDLGKVASDTIDSIKGAKKGLLLGTLGSKFGGSAGLKLFLEAYFEGWQKLNSLLYDQNGNIKIQGVKQEDIDNLYAEFGKMVEEKGSTGTSVFGTQG